MSFGRKLRRAASKGQKVPAISNSPFDSGRPYIEESGADSTLNAEWFATLWRTPLMSIVSPRVNEIVRMLQTGALAFTSGIHFESGQIKADVHTGRKVRHTITLCLPTWPPLARAQAVSLVAEDPKARDEVRHGIVTRHLISVLQRKLLHLPPIHAQELSAKCSCGSKLPFCLHAIAMVYILTDVLAEAPHFLFRVRGLSLDLLATGLDQCLIPDPPVPGPIDANLSADKILRAPEPLPQPLPASPVFSGATAIATLGHLDGWRLTQQPEVLWHPSVLQAARAARERAPNHVLKRIS